MDREKKRIEQLRKLAAEEDLPVFGIAPASKMSDERSGYRPNDILPGARSLISFGYPMPESVYRMQRYGAETAWRSQNLFYRRLDAVSLRFAGSLAETGAEAVPVYGCMPLGVNEKGVVVGYINQMRMAEAAGIGTIGRNGLLVHSRYGSRLMLGGVLTTAALPAVRFPEIDEPGCPPDCRICSEACPVHAIMAEKKKVDIMRCLGYTARTPNMSKGKFFFLSKINPGAAARYLSLTSFDEHTFHTCSRCVAFCPYGDSKNG